MSIEDALKHLGLNKYLTAFKDLDYDTLTKAYHKKILAHHPDHHPDDPEATSKTQLINAAFDVLKTRVPKEKPKHKDNAFPTYRPPALPSMPKNIEPNGKKNWWA